MALGRSPCGFAKSLGLDQDWLWVWSSPQPRRPTVSNDWTHPFALMGCSLQGFCWPDYLNMLERTCGQSAKQGQQFNRVLASRAFGRTGFVNYNVIDQQLGIIWQQELNFVHPVTSAWLALASVLPFRVSAEIQRELGPFAVFKPLNIDNMGVLHRAVDQQNLHPVVPLQMVAEA